MNVSRVLITVQIVVFLCTRPKRRFLCITTVNRKSLSQLPEKGLTTCCPENEHGIWKSSHLQRKIIFKTSSLGFQPVFWGKRCLLGFRQSLLLLYCRQSIFGIPGFYGLFSSLSHLLSFVVCKFQDLPPWKEKRICWSLMVGRYEISL